MTMPKNYVVGWCYNRFRLIQGKYQRGSELVRFKSRAAVVESLAEVSMLSGYTIKWVANERKGRIVYQALILSVVNMFGTGQRIESG